MQFETSFKAIFEEGPDLRIQSLIFFPQNQSKYSYFLYYINYFLLLYK